MKCVIPSLNIKVFARAIHSLSRVGEDLYVEPSNYGVAFRTVNSSRSAFGSFFFNSNFFSLFDFKVAESEQENFKCKVAMKAFINAFKSINTIDRSVEKCRLVIDSDEDRLVVNMCCKHGVNKTYNLSFIECETMQAVFDKESCRFDICGQSRVLCDAFINFQTGQEEVTLSVTPQRALLKNYVDDDPDPTKAIHTELQLESDEFDEYSVDSDCDVTFCLKEVRSLLSFSEPVNLPVLMRFSKPGSPIIFSVENSSMFEANFVLATLSSSDVVSTPRPNGTESTPQVTRRKPNTNPPESESTPQRNSERIDEDVELSLSIHRRVTPISSIANAKCHLPDSAKQRPSPISINEININESNGLNLEREDDEEEVIAGTPPAKKRRYFFKRCFEPTFDALNLTPFQKVLAEDSDEET